MSMKFKKLMLICGPVSSRSGYGAHTRDLINSFLDYKDKYDVRILDVRWGDCPRTALDEDNEQNKLFKSCLINGVTPNQLPKQPDIYVDIRIPNEWQQIGKFNIGVTAGIETNLVSGEWLKGCNKMDLVIVPSEHSKDGFVKTSYDEVKHLPSGEQQNIGMLKLRKPIEVLFEGSDEDIYKSLKKDEIDSEFFDWLNEKVPEKFAFLSVGQWTKGGFGEDRKDVGTLVKTFYESFANKKKQPALILKTNGATFSIIDREQCLDKINLIKDRFPKDWKLPNVYLLHGEFKDEEMNYLYNHPKIKAMVSFTHGEGYGRPLQEATMVGLPVAVSDWSGHLDFLDNANSILIPGKLDKVPSSQIWEDIITEESKWFYVNTGEAYKIFNYLFNNIDSIKKDAEKLRKTNINKFTLKNMSKKLDSIITKYTDKLPSEVKIKLPKLKKVNKELPKLPNMEKDMEIMDVKNN